MSFGGGGFGSFGGDAAQRAQIMLSLRSEGTTEIAAVRQEIAALQAQAQGLEAIYKSGQVGLRDYLTTMKDYERQVRAFIAVERDLASAQEAAGAAALKSAEDFARAAVKHEQFMEREASKAEETAIREAQAFADVAVKHEQFLEKEAAAAEAAALREAEAFAAAATKHEQFLEREAAAAEAAALREAEAFAKAATAHEKFLETYNRQAVAAANQQLGGMGIISTADVADDLAARRQQQNAIAGVAREQQHLNDVLIAGLQSEQTAAKLTANELAQLNAAKNTGTQKANTYGYAILHVSHAFQDLQYGIAATLNNIPLIVTSMGGGPGLAGVTMAAAVGVQLLREDFGTLSESLGIVAEKSTGAADQVDVLKGRIKELEKSPLTLAVDVSELETAKEKLKELEAARKAADAAREGKSVFEAEAGKEAKQFLEGYGDEFKAAHEAMVGVKVGEMAGRDPVIKAADEAKARAEKIMLSIDEQLTTIQDADQRNALLMSREIQVRAIAEAERKKGLAAAALRANADMAIGGLRAGFEAGDRPDARGELAGRLRQVGAHGLAAGVESITPEEMEEQGRAEADFDRALDAQKRGIAARERAEKRAAAAAKKGAAEGRKGDAAAKKDETAHERAVREQAAIFGKPVVADSGPASLADAILARMVGGQDTDAILASLVPGVADAMLEGGAPPELVAEVAATVVRELEAKLRAEAAAGGDDVDVGAAALIGERERKRQAAGKRAGAADARQGRQDQLAAIAAGLQRNFGVGEDQAAALAPEVARMIARQGMDADTAARVAMANLARLLNQQNIMLLRQQAQWEQLNGFVGEASMRLQALQAQVGRGRARRPAIMPVFPMN